MSRLVRAALVALICLVVAACQVDTVLEVQVDEDGSGTVTVSVGLDQEALARVPNLDDQLQTDDLAEAGWTLTGPEVEDGVTWYRASKPFADPAEGVSVVQEVTGPDGVLKQVDLTRDDGFLSTEYSFTASGDFSGGLAAFSDDQVTELLGDPLGGNIAEIESSTGAPAPGQVTFTVRTELPGSAAKTFTLDAANVERQPVTASSSQVDWPVVLLLAAAVALLVAAAVSAIVLSARRRRRRHAEGRAATIAAAADELEPEPAPEPKPARRLEVVVLDGQGVVFESGPELVTMLTDFAHDHGSVVSAEQTAASYERATLGELDDAGLWEELGVPGDAGELTDTFLVGCRVTPGLRPFLERMAERDLRVVIATNDVEAFATKLRRAHRLDEMTADWVVSSDVGARLPDRRVFDTCVRVTGAPPSNCFFIGRDPEMLRVAREVGMAAAWFRPESDGDDAEDDSLPFPVITSFEDLGIGR